MSPQKVGFLGLWGHLVDTMCYWTLLHTADVYRFVVMVSWCVFPAPGNLPSTIFGGLKIWTNVGAITANTTGMVWDHVYTVYLYSSYISCILYMFPRYVFTLHPMVFIYTVYTYIYIYIFFTHFYVLTICFFRRKSHCFALPTQVIACLMPFREIFGWDQRWATTSPPCMDYIPWM